MRHTSAEFRNSLRKMIFSPGSFSLGDKLCPSMEKGVEEDDEGFPPLFYLGLQVGYVHQDDSHGEGGDVRVLPEFPLLVPFIVLLPLLSPLLLTNQVPMISIKGGAGTVFVLSLISEDICCTRKVFVFILGYYKLRMSAIPAGHYLLSALIFE